MSEGIRNFPGGKWHESNQMRESRRAQSVARKGITRATYLKTPGEIIQQADSSSGVPIGDILIVTGFRFDEESWDEPLPRYVKAVTLQIESGTLTYDPGERLEIPDTQAIRRFGKLNEKIHYPFFEAYYQTENRIRQMQAWGFSTEMIENALKPTQANANELNTKTEPSALRLLKEALVATLRGRIF